MDAHHHVEVGLPLLWRLYSTRGEVCQVLGGLASNTPRPDPEDQPVPSLLAKQSLKFLGSPY